LLPVEAMSGFERGGGASVQPKKPRQSAGFQS
jgi:hypothetical protein